MQDTIYDPFGIAADEQSFLNFEKIIEDAFPADSDSLTQNIIVLSEVVRIQQRVRYGIW